MEALNAHKARVRDTLSKRRGELQTLAARQTVLKAQIDSLTRGSTSEQRTANQILSEQRKQDRDVLKRGPARYLANPSTLDAGILHLYWDRLVFSGWRGNLTVPLIDIASRAVHPCVLPSRVGVPIVGRFWPGKLQHGETLILTFISDDRPGAEEQAVIAGLRTADNWLEALDRVIPNLADVLEARRTGDAQAQEALSQKAKLDAERGDLTKKLQALEGEINRLKSAIQVDEHELNRPDWEETTIRVTGSRLKTQFNQAVKRAAADGWELVSISSSSKTEMVGRLRRIRRVP